MSRRIACAALLLATACGEPPTSMRIEVVGGDLAVPSDIDALRFRVVSDRGREVDETFAIATPFPHSLVVLTREDEAADGLAITVQGLLAGAVRTQAGATARFTPGAQRNVTLRFESACLDVVCAAGLVCAGGECGLEGDAGMLRPDMGPGDVGLLSGPDMAGVDAGRVVVACRGVDNPCAGRLVISELAAEGPGNDASDEFVELYNRSGDVLDLNGVTLFYSATAGSTPGQRARIGRDVRLEPGRFFLFASSRYSGAAQPDGVDRWTTPQGLSDRRGAVEIRGGGTIDRVGWRRPDENEDVAAEGSPALAPTEGEYGAGASIERFARSTSSAETMRPGGADVDAGNGFDTEDNAVDTHVRVSRDPQSLASPAESP